MKEIRYIIIVIVLAWIIFLLPACKDAESSTPDSYADILYGDYDSGGITITVGSKSGTDSEFKLIAEGRHGSTNRMTQVYERDGAEIAISSEFLNNAYNLLVEQAEIKTGTWEYQTEKGLKWMMVVLPAKAEGSYFALYAESKDMTIEELAEAIDGTVVIDCSWGESFIPELAVTEGK
jgi:hypothetical protein